MIFQLKSIKHSPSLSEETEAFQATIWVCNKRAGYARNSGIGGNTEVRITVPELADIARNNARAWLDIAEPYPVDYATPAVVDDKGHPHYQRIDAIDRVESTPDGYLEYLVDRLFSNSLTIKECKKVTTKVTWKSTDCATADYVRINVKPSDLTDEQKAKLESKNDFQTFLYNRDIDTIARLLGYTHDKSGPLVTAVSL